MSTKNKCLINSNILTQTNNRQSICSIVMSIAVLYELICLNFKVSKRTTARQKQKMKEKYIKTQELPWPVLVSWRPLVRCQYVWRGREHWRIRGNSLYMCMCTCLCFAIFRLLWQPFIWSNTLQKTWRNIVSRSAFSSPFSCSPFLSFMQPTRHTCVCWFRTGGTKTKYKFPHSLSLYYLQICHFSLFTHINILILLSKVWFLPLIRIHFVLDAQ